MFSRKAEAPFSVHVPTPAEDRPSWTSVGVIATIGFLVGIAWPKFAGVRMGPSVPENASQTAATATQATPPPPEPTAAPASPSAPAAPASSVAAVATAPLPSSSSLPLAPVTVSAVSRGFIVSCKTAEGDSLKGAECGSLPGLDNLVIPRLRKLAGCPEAAKATGKVRLIVKADFARSALTVELGRNTGFAGANAILACAKEAFVGGTPGNAPHDNQRYSLAYSVTFGASGQTASSEGAIPPATHATADVTQTVWDVALVREAPKTGKVVARLSRGTTLQIGPASDGWYPVKFGDGFTMQGWIYRGAIGH